MDSTYIIKSEEHTYFHKTDVEKVKLIHNLLVQNMEHHYTLNELSEKFKVTLTAMTSCFKGVYGKPINTYMREYRMSYAAK
jgi:AraC-like DNA-binding protein